MDYEKPDPLLKDAPGYSRPLPEGELEKRPPQVAGRAKMVRLAAQGCNARRASELLGIGYGVVCKVYNDASFRKQVFELVEGAFEKVDGAFTNVQLSLHDRIRAKSEEAFEVLCEILDNPDEMPALRAKIAVELLDRNPESQAGTTVRHGALANDQALAVAARAAEEMNKVLPMRRKV